MKWCSYFSILLIFLATVSCENVDLTEHQDEHRMRNFQESLYNIFERLGKTVNRNQSITEDKSGNMYFLNIVKNLSLIVPSNSNNFEKEADNSGLLERVTQLESEVSDLKLNNARKMTYDSLVEDINSCKYFNSSGVYQFPCINKDVFCEMEAFHGGWIVIQQRKGFKLSFIRGWASYRDGFGIAGEDSEFWLGNEAVHQITQSGEYELVVELKSANGTYGFARYSYFELAPESDHYRMSIGKYNGTVQDKLRHHNGAKFTTNDKDNESWTNGNCADYWSSGWWYNNCYSHSTLNRNGGPYWGAFAYYGTYSRMMIRRK